MEKSTYIFILGVILMCSICIIFSCSLYTLYGNKEQENICDFCKKIYDSEREVYNSIQQDKNDYKVYEDFNALYKDGGTINMFIYQLGEIMTIEDIKYCPYCGNSLVH